MKLKILIISVFTAVLLSAPLFAEYVFINDGAIFEGNITSDSASSVTLKTKDKKFKQISRATIMRILYTELYMGKVYVQKTDGKNIICYMVDEDRESYTFRKELYNPEEFKLKRDQVLFMARGNPSGLEGEVDTFSAELKWFPPYNPVKKYRIYIKGPKDKKYRTLADTGSKSYTVKDLKSNTKYQVYVTAIDNSGDESLPSNEFAVNTKNVAPEKPVVNPVTKLTDGTVKLSWQASTDSDGKVAGYRVFKKLDGKDSLLAETKKTEYSVSKDEKYERLYIAAIDDLKAESEYSKFNLGLESLLGLSFEPAVIYPFGNLGKITNIGYGATLRALYTNFLLDGIEAGVWTAFYYLPGKSGFHESESKSGGIMIIPLMLSGGYSFYPAEGLSVTPRLSAGGYAVLYNYSYYDIPSSSKKTVNDFEIDPGFTAGLSLRYDFSNNMFITLSGDYGMFFEKSGNFSYSSGSIGAGFWF